MELPVKRILEGVDPSRVASPDTIRNPQALDAFIQLAASWGG
jgi:acetoacetyl-CoA synthetase